MKKKLGLFCMILGVILVVSAAGLLIYNKLEDKSAGESANRILEVMQNSQSEESLALPHVMAVKEIDGHDYIGFIVIPKINRELPIRADWNFSELRAAPQRYCGSIYDNNLILASHSYNYHFGPIYKLEIGDDIFFKDVTGKAFSYKVTNVETLNASDIDKLLDVKSDLTLFTCDYSGTKRVTVRCDRVK